MQIKKRREREQEEMEQKKRKLEETLKINKIENKFAVHYDAVEQQLKVNIAPERQSVIMNCENSEILDIAYILYLTLGRECAK